jgi:hypothetical protein
LAFGEHVQPDGDIAEAGQAGLADVIWRKSSWSAYNGNCVEVGGLGGGLVAVRDSKETGCGPVLAFDAASWCSFIDDVKKLPKPESIL